MNDTRLILNLWRKKNEKSSDIIRFSLLSKMQRVVTVAHNHS